MNKKKILVISLIVVAIIVIIIAMVLTKPKRQENITTEPVTSTAESQNKLSKAQLEELQNFFEEQENNGFLLSEYQQPAEIDLKKVFYNGTNGKEVTEEEVEAYSEAINEPRSTDWHLFGCTSNDVRGIFKEKTGSDDIGDLNSRLEGWVYLPQYDKYYIRHSDSIYTKVNCIEGTDEGDGIYKIKVKLMNVMTLDNTILITVKRQGDSYLFVSNEIISSVEDYYSLDIYGLTSENTQKIPDVNAFKKSLKEYIYKNGLSKSDTAKLLSTTEKGNIVQYKFQLTEDGIRDREIIIAHVNTVTGICTFGQEK